ncbi:TatD family hydrolase [bacterium]|nr:TatD family hydrolase [bacterium]
MAWKPLDAVPDLPPLHGAALIDSHCHLDMDFDADRGAVLARARAAGVEAMITIGASGRFDANRAAVEIADANEAVYATVGIHPHEAASLDDAAIAVLGELAAHPKVVGIGETGLDYHYEHAPRPAQRAAFARFLGLARALRKPIVVHLREADDDAVEVLRGERGGEIGGVIHCFSGDAVSVRRFLDLGFHISFSGIVTFKTADALREAARLVPSDRLMLETDAPFLAPVPYRGRRNEPALVAQTAATIAAVRGESIAQVAAATNANTRRLFHLHR